jgi:hypothetical protein
MLNEILEDCYKRLLLSDKYKQSADAKDVT